MQVQPYLSFEGRADEAIDFYKQAIGAEVTGLMRWKDMPGGPQPGSIPPGSENKVMHAALKVGETTVMASDGNCSGKADFKGISLALTAKGVGEAEKLFKALSDGGKVMMPMAKTFFAERFGMLSDKFGVTWMVVTEGMPSS